MATAKRAGRAGGASKGNGKSPIETPPLVPVVGAFELRRSPILGGPVRVELSPTRTLLVGRNGAGKSAIFDAIVAAVGAATRGAHGVDATIAPPSFRCDFAVGGDAFTYESSWDVAPGRTGEVFHWSETCVSQPSGRVVWSVRDGKARRANDEGTVLVPPGAGMLAVPPPEGWDDPALAALGHLFHSVHRVRAGVPRSDARSFIFIERKKGAKRWAVPPHANRLQSTCVALLNWAETQPEVFAEFAAVGRRLKLWTRVDPHIAPFAEDKEFGMVLADGESLADLSDGTVRVVELLRYVLSPITRMLLVEEPETGLHPGLVEGVLAELDAYSSDHQWIASTHSPLVVGRVKPDEVRLVMRHAAITTLQSLTPEQVDRVGPFLTDDGTLGEFVFGGGVDD